MKIPFKTHKIFVTLDDDKMYQLFRDFSKKEVDKKAFPEKFLTQSRENPFVILSSQQVIEALAEERIKILKEYKTLKNSSDEHLYNKEYREGFDHAMGLIQDMLESTLFD